MSERNVVFPVGGARLAGTLAIPERARGLVVFAHGSGSSRKSPRNELVARGLRAGGLGTLLFDLLTEDEGRRRANVFDIDLLTNRILSALRFLRRDKEAAPLALGLFGASTGAAAALCAASLDQGVRAVVSRGGRPDLAESSLPLVPAPTLLIVGELDREVLALNEAARRLLRCETRLAVVRGATHLFEEPGCLEEVGQLAREWFEQHLAQPSERGQPSAP